MLKPLLHPNFFTGLFYHQVWLPVQFGGSETGASSLAASDTETETSSSVATPSSRQLSTRRIMLTLPLDLYPLTLLFDEAVVVGAESELLDLPLRQHSVRAAIVERKTQLFMQHILRQVRGPAARQGEIQSPPQCLFCHGSIELLFHLFACLFFSL